MTPLNAVSDHMLDTISRYTNVPNNEDVSPTDNFSVGKKLFLLADTFVTN